MAGDVLMPWPAPEAWARLWPKNASVRQRPALEEAESFFLFRDGGLAAHGFGHCPDCLCNGRVLTRERRGGSLHSAHSCVVVGNFPACRLGEGLGHKSFVNPLGAGVESVDYDFEFGAA